MSTLTITNEAIQTLPPQTHCYSGRWECDDSAHDCPGKCGYIEYKDENGNIVEEFGFCKADTNIQIVASEIIQVIGLNPQKCPSFHSIPKLLSIGPCINGVCNVGGNSLGTANFYTTSNDLWNSQGTIYNDPDLSIPYNGVSGWFTTNYNNQTWVVMISGDQLSFACVRMGGC